MATKDKKTLSKNDYNELLSVADAMNTVLEEATALPPNVKEAIIQARTASWEAFKNQKEKTMRSP